MCNKNTAITSIIICKKWLKNLAKRINSKSKRKLLKIVSEHYSYFDPLFFFCFQGTFGLKNKNKSKKVQVFVERVEKGVKNTPTAIEAKKNKEAKEKIKLEKEAAEAELKALYGDAIPPGAALKVCPLCTTSMPHVIFLHSG